MNKEGSFSDLKSKSIDTNFHFLDSFSRVGCTFDSTTASQKGYEDEKDKTLGLDSDNIEVEAVVDPNAEWALNRVGSKELHDPGLNVFLESRFIKGPNDN